MNAWKLWIIRVNVWIKAVNIKDALEWSKSGNISRHADEFEESTRVKYAKFAKMSCHCWTTTQNVAMMNRVLCRDVVKLKRVLNNGKRLNICFSKILSNFEWPVYLLSRKKNSTSPVLQKRVTIVGDKWKIFLLYSTGIVMKLEFVYFAEILIAQIHRRLELPLRKEAKEETGSVWCSWLVITNVFKFW